MPNLVTITNGIKSMASIPLMILATLGLLGAVVASTYFAYKSMQCERIRFKTFLILMLLILIIGGLVAVPIIKFWSVALG